ncbi:uncharacterized protein LOC110110428 [Dendrobium catenatum]|uniref:uncharacterized protein LOC110110428 n=1 Tax=Dendrobium catenatum TaxID=906689 RepID=UPI0009F5A0C2|nr:uncharacterized protein LOC110110428 [Dendrobium catenatum]
MEASFTSQTTDPKENQLDSSCVIPTSLKFVISNIKIVVPTQLSFDNYAVWRSQILKLLNANGFSSFLLPSASPPPRFTDLSDGSQKPNLKYQEWCLVDQNLAAALCSTISPVLLPYVIHLESTSAIWATIERQLQSSNRSRVIQLRNELHNIQIKNQMMVQYLTQIKNIVDNINAVGAVLDQEDIILYTLNGLPSSYNAFKTSIRTMLHPIDLDNLYSLLISEEINLQANSIQQVTITESSTALYTQHGRGRRSRGRSYSQNSRTNNASSIQCQISNKKGHSTNNCWHRSNLTINPPENQTNNSRTLVATTDPGNQD